MAHMNQEKKAKIKVVLDPIMKHYRLKYSLGVNGHSAIVCNVKSGGIDFLQNYRDNHSNQHGEAAFIRDYIDVNVYHYDKHFSGDALLAITEIVQALNTDNYDRSDAMSDYFDVGHYVYLNIGRWNQPYEIAA